MEKKQRSGLTGRGGDQIANDFRRDHDAHCGRNERRTAGNIAPGGAFTHGAGRTDAVVAAAQCGVVVGLDGLFIGKDDLELADFTLAKLGAHDAREGQTLVFSI